MHSPDFNEVQRQSEQIAKELDVLKNEELSEQQKVEHLLSTVESSLQHADMHQERKNVYTELIKNGVTDQAAIEQTIQQHFEKKRNNTEAPEALVFTTKEVHPALRQAYKNTFRVLVDGAMEGLGFIGNQRGKSAIPKEILPTDDEGNTVLEGVQIELSDGTLIPLSNDHIEYDGSSTVHLTPEGLKNRPRKTYIPMAETVNPTEQVYAITTKGAVAGTLSDITTAYKQQIDTSDSFERTNQNAGAVNTFAGGPVVNAAGELVAFFADTQNTNSLFGRNMSFSLSDTQTRNELQRLNEDTLDANLG